MYTHTKNVQIHTFFFICMACMLCWKTEKCFVLVWMVTKSPEYCFGIFCMEKHWKPTNNIYIHIFMCVIFNMYVNKPLPTRCDAGYHTNANRMFSGKWWAKFPTLVCYFWNSPIYVILIFQIFCICVTSCIHIDLYNKNVVFNLCYL